MVEEINVKNLNLNIKYETNSRLCTSETMRVRYND